MSEIALVDDMDLFASETEDDVLAELSQDLYHRLIEPPGSNIDDPARGFGLEGLLSGGGSAKNLGPTLKNGIEQELRKDVRVQDCSATVTQPTEGTWQIDIRIVADEGELDITLVFDGSGNLRRVA